MEIPKTMKIFGILNLSPDSFSGFNSIEDAHKIILSGADFIDIGAESTRPNASPVSANEEINRLAPALEKLSAYTLSLDTYKPQTASYCLKYSNIKFLNDVNGFNNPEMIKIAAQSDVNLIVMHSLTVPADKNIVLSTPPVDTLKDWFTQKLKQLKAAGITENRIIFDVGIGFGKSPVQCRELILHAPEMAIFCHNLGVKLLYGHSRKSFMNIPLEQRDVETAHITRYLAMANVDFVRVHDVTSNKKAITGGGLLQT